MKNFCHDAQNGYQESIQNGLSAIRKISGRMSTGSGTAEERISQLKTAIATSEAIVIGAGAGLSTSAGLTYSGARFNRYFYDFAKAYGIRDMYSGGFHAFPDEQTRWAWWARHIYYNRYIDPPKPVYAALLSLVHARNYFVITTNVDHQFQRAGFDRKRLFYTQGDYGLFQSTNPSVQMTFDNETWVMMAMEAQGFVKDEHGVYQVPQEGKIAMRLPKGSLPKCPVYGGDVAMNLRADNSFVEDEGWHKASEAYASFLHSNENSHVLYLELGVGENTPVIVKFPFWQRTLVNENAVYACINYGEAYCPAEIENRSICISSDIGEVLDAINGTMSL